MNRMHHIAMLLVVWLLDDMHPTAEQLEVEGMDFGRWA